jgi:hypothetical protein
MYVAFVMARNPFNIFFFRLYFCKNCVANYLHDFWIGSTKECQQFVWELAQGHPEERSNPIKGGSVCGYLDYVEYTK